MEIDKQGSTPLYIQVAEDIQHKIDLGLYQSNQQIPTEQELSAAYQVSRITVRKAVQLLAERAVLEKRQGKGTFVLKQKQELDISKMYNFTSSCRMMGKEPSAKLIRKELLRLHPHDQKDFGFSESDGRDFVVIERVRLADDIPVILEKNYFSLDYRFLLKEDLRGSLYALLAARGIKPAYAIKEIGIHMVDAREGRLLHMTAGAGSLRVNEQVYTASDQSMLHYCQQIIYNERWHYKLVLRSNY